MRAARYARVSRRDQANNTSIPNQLDRCEAYLPGQGWKLVATFVEPGESGEDLDRPSMIALRRAARRGEFDILVVYTLDRLTRDIDDLFLLRHEFRQIGIRIYAIADGVEVTTADPDDLLSVLLKGYFGQRELYKIRQRTQDGIRRAVLEGKYPGGNPAFGYRRGQDGRLEIDEENARTVRMMFGWAAEAMSTHAIAARLDSLEIPTPYGGKGYKSRRRNDGTQRVPGHWTAATVRHILRNQSYLGRWTYSPPDESPIVLELDPIIDQQTWDRAQAALDSNRRRSRKPTYRYLLRGLIRCQCGAAYCGTKPRRPGGHHTYHCLARWDYRKIHRPKCNGATVNGVKLEEAIWAEIEEFIRQPHLVTAELSQRRPAAGVGIATQLAEVDRAVAEREAELDRYLEQYGRGVFPMEKLEGKVMEVRGHLAALRAYRQSLAEEQRRSDAWQNRMLDVINTLVELQNRIEDLGWDEKRAVVEMLVKSIVIETSRGNPTAHVTYSFQRPDPSTAPIPIELVSLFTPQPAVFELERTVAL